MRHSVALPAAALLALMLGDAPATADPNIVFMMADDLGWNDVGYHGSEIQTPHVDSIAQQGVQLDRYYAAPLCSPTRAAFLTGRNPLRLGVDRPVEVTGGLPLSETLLPEMLREAGYQTAIAGKWHLGMGHVMYHPQNRGFGSAYGHLGPAVDYWTHIWTGGLDWHRDGKVLEEEGYSTELIGAEAERVIRERDAAKPLFLYVAFNAPHAPIQPLEEDLIRHEAIENPNRRAYAAVVGAMDRAVGRILAALDAEGMTGNTLVVWCSDNGGAPRMGADNTPLRGGKGGAFEGGIRVPATAWQPGAVEGGGKVTQMVTAADWLATILEAAGVSQAEGLELDGISMWPALAERKSVERTEPYVIGVFRNMAVIDGDWKYVEAEPRGGGQLASHLFRLDRDPEETTDLGPEHPDRLSAMAAYLNKFPRAPTVSPDIVSPGRARRGRAAPGQARRGGPPGRGGGNVDGWKEVTRPPWMETARVD